MKLILNPKISKKNLIDPKSKTQILLGFIFFLFVASCDVEDQSAQNLPIINNLNSIGGEVILNPNENLNAQELAKILDFCKIVQDQNVIRFNSQASYIFSFKKCATENNVAVSVRNDLALAQLPNGKTIWVKRTGEAINEFFRENLSVTSGPLGAMCPGLLSGASTQAPRYLVKNEKSYVGIYVGQGTSTCGDGVGPQDYCLILDELNSLGGQTHQISSRTMSSFVTKARSLKQSGLQLTRNYLSLASNCRLSEPIYQVDAQLILE